MYFASRRRLSVMVCILAKGSGDCEITRIPWPSPSSHFAEPSEHYPRAGSAAPAGRQLARPGLCNLSDFETRILTLLPGKVFMPSREPLGLGDFSRGQR